MSEEQIFAQLQEMNERINDHQRRIESLEAGEEIAVRKKFPPTTITITSDVIRPDDNGKERKVYSRGQTVTIPEDSARALVKRQKAVYGESMVDPEPVEDPQAEETEAPKPTRRKTKKK